MSSSIVVAFPKQEIAQNVKKILAQSGYSVQASCTTGAQALASMGDLEGGIVVSGPRFVDMMYTELYEYLPEGFQMLLLASASSIQDKQVMEGQVRQRKKRMRNIPRMRSEADRQVIERAKLLLMERNSFSEEEAHRDIQKRSMDNGAGLVEVSQMILSLMGEG